MAFTYTSLPVYEQKQRILDTLADEQAVVVQSPTGSGKTTQIPVILHEAGYSAAGIVGVTQPRRIAALSVSEFISKQLGTAYPGLVGYKMRFEDKTDFSTRIKIMTDGILLQEVKFDPCLSKYSVVMVDEAHERSLNIDFTLGLLKRVLAERKDFKVIISSATMNAEAFSHYFDGAPIVTIDTVTYPVNVVYDPPAGATSTISPAAADALLQKIAATVERVLAGKESGAILCFLPGEKIIKDCLRLLASLPFGRRLWLLPLYGRLSKEEQERVFAPPPSGRKKLILSTNIAETSVTIADVTAVIDTGLAKLNAYNARNFTSSLTELPVSKASCNQRKGRAGRTEAGTCYRLYAREDFEKRELYTEEEIHRTDLSEVALRMAELGITDFERFDFISPPGREGMSGAVDTLRMLKALEADNTLSGTGKLMAEFPLLPRQSRIIAESIQRYPDVLEEVLIAAAFLSAKSPFVLPAGKEMDARKAHHAFRDLLGDFVSYLKMYRTFVAVTNKEQFCEKNYLDYQVMTEICNIKEQLEQIAARLGLPLSSGGSMDDYLCCVAAGMIQFVCVREGRESYRSLTADHIQIHPGSSVFRSDPLYIVAGEIVRTSRMFAMSVSPLARPLLKRIDAGLDAALDATRQERRGRNGAAGTPSPLRGRQDKAAADASTDGTPRRRKDGSAAADGTREESVLFGGERFALTKLKGKKYLVLPLEQFRRALEAAKDDASRARIAGFRGMLTVQDRPLLSGEKAALIAKAAENLDLAPLAETEWGRKTRLRSDDAASAEKLVSSLGWVLRVTRAKPAGQELGFIGLFTDGRGGYCYKVSRGFPTALNESLSSLETLIDEAAQSFAGEQKAQVNAVYRKLAGMYE